MCVSHSAAPVTALVTGEGKVTAAGDTPTHPNTAVPCGLPDTAPGECVPKSLNQLWVTAPSV